LFFLAEENRNAIFATFTAFRDYKKLFDVNSSW